MAETASPAQAVARGEPSIATEGHRGGSAGAAASSEGSWQNMSSRQLLKECRRRCLDTTGCTEREDLLRLLRQIDKPIVLRQAPSKAKRTGRMGTETVWDRKVPANLAEREKCLYLLGLDTVQSVTLAQLTSAYRRAAMESHPDRRRNHARQIEANELFQKVRDAFDFLRDEAELRPIAEHEPCSRTMQL